jgi:carbonic anhydrase
MRKLLKFLFLSVLIITLTINIAYAKNSSESHGTVWNYQGEKGPANWASLDESFSLCKNGKNQSPIDIQDAKKRLSNSIEFDYKFTPLKIVNNGHAIEVVYEPGSTIKIDGQEYELKQFHFHGPSEHQFKSNSYPMEVHLVHKNAEGKIAVVGIFMEVGQANEFVETIWANIPEKGENEISGVSINVSALPPKNQVYYYYEGSLTTPPCTEGVNWYVLKTPIQVSREQVARFYSFYNHNARPLQSLNDRQIDMREE